MIMGSKTSPPPSKPKQLTGCANYALNKEHFLQLSEVRQTVGVGSYILCKKSKKLQVPGVLINNDIIDLTLALK